MRNLPPADYAINLTVWMGLFLALAAWQARALLTRRTAGVLDLVRLARRSLLLRSVVLGYWGWVGWHLFVRTTP